MLQAKVQTSPADTHAQPTSTNVQPISIRKLDRLETTSPCFAEGG
jgi:hypothetical protein